jgi:hypothetical protein
MDPFPGDESLRIIMGGFRNIRMYCPVDRWKMCIIQIQLMTFHVEKVKVRIISCIILQCALPFQTLKMIVIGYLVLCCHTIKHRNCFLYRARTENDQLSYGTKWIQTLKNDCDRLSVAMP